MTTTQRAHTKGPTKIICPYCAPDIGGCEHCHDTGVIERTVWFMVADLNNPNGEPFAVIKADTSKRSGNGIEAVIASLHWSREVAQSVADDLNRAFNQELHMPEIVDAETVQVLLDLLNPLHGSLDEQLFDERKNEELDIPRDREYSVNVTEAQERDLTQAVLILEDRKRQFNQAPKTSLTPRQLAEQNAEQAQEIERLRGLCEASRTAISYSLDMQTSDPAGVLLQTVNKLDAALSSEPAKEGDKR